MALINITPAQMQLMNQLVTLFENNVNANLQIEEWLAELGGQIHDLEQGERGIVQTIFELQNLCSMLQQREVQSAENFIHIIRVVDFLQTRIEALRRQTRPPPPPQDYTFNCPNHDGNIITFPVARDNILGIIQWYCPIGLSRTCRNNTALGQDVREHIRRCMRHPDFVCPGPPLCS